ncbi:protein kilB [Streptomyces goshikiensis]|uniref:protein kilB n=1 Tax=Streptomyces goshikiensis TaxID=1942 RepID=UPI00364F971A
MLSGIIAAASALLGVALSTILAHRQARAVRTEARTEQARQDVLAAATALAAALTDHRRAMWVREDARLAGAEPDAFAKLRADSHATRSAITAPLTAIQILAPALASAADRAAAATYALRDTGTRTELDRAREAAITALAALTAAVRAEIGR